MNYIIHHTDNLEAQIQTCLLASDDDVAEVDSLTEVGKVFSKVWYKKGYRKEYERLCAEKETPAYVNAEYEPEQNCSLTQADLERAWNSFRISDLEGQLQELKDWKFSALRLFDEIDLQKAGKLMGLTVGDAVLPNIIPHLEFMRDVRNAQAATIRKFQGRIDEMQKVIDAAAPIVIGEIVSMPLQLDLLYQALKRWYKCVDGDTPKS